ncbi:hypothetical protein PCE1_000673 [Barthelona sp. PCE]
MTKTAIFVEVCQTNSSILSEEQIHSAVGVYITKFVPTFRPGILVLDERRFAHCNDISFVRISEMELDVLHFWEVDVHIRVFQLNSEEHNNMTLEDDDKIHATTQWLLPHCNFENEWEQLHFDGDIKKTCLQYCRSALIFAEKEVSSSYVTFQKVLLAYGPPGTGKTTLIKGLAQKLAIRMNDVFPHTHFLEVNAHSLFSRWFSESGKLVQRLFSHIQELTKDENTLVCVLIDEVESLVSSREASANGTEPGDAIRVVNACLTQLDQLSRQKNVFVFCTSNYSKSLDVAFIDRADLKLFIGNPSIKARFNILKSAIDHMYDCEILSHTLGGESLKKLMQICEKGADISGRTLRKLPFLSYAKTYANQTSCIVDLESFLISLDCAIQDTVDSL